MKQSYYTVNGQLEKIEDFTSDFLNIDDISIGLGNMCRFNGQCEFYSVAEHSVICSQLMEEYFYKDIRMIFAALLHDVSEAYLHDIIRPVQDFLNRHTARDCYVNFDLKFLHSKIQKIVHHHYKLSLTPDEYETVIVVDNLALDIEGSKFFPDKWNLNSETASAVVRHHGLIKHLNPTEAKFLFLGRYTNVYKRYVAQGFMATEKSCSSIPLRPKTQTHSFMRTDSKRNI